MRIGLLLPHSGPAGLWRVGGQACARLAAEEGAGGEPVDLIQMDCGETPETAAAAATALRDDHGVDVVVGMQPSHQRNAITRALSGEVGYIYTPQYEGGWCGPGALPLGVTDAEAMAPSIAWLARRQAVSRWFFVGNDYLWPRAAHGVAAATVRAAGGVMAGAAMIPFGQCDYDILFSRIKRSRADAVAVVLLGEEGVRFHRAFAAAGLARRAARFCLGCDETLLWALTGAEAEGLYACQPYFAGADDPSRDAMLDSYEGLFAGASPPVTSLTLGVYDGVRLARALCAGARGARRRSIAKRLQSGFDRRAALAKLNLPATHNGSPRLHIGEADGAAFRSECLA
ncbi:MAG: ABC transporter substrate-binding protein [Pseudomonadota bacterium]